MRTCDGFGVERVVFGGYTPWPSKGLPHEQAKITAQIAKTALGAEQLVPYEYAKKIVKLLKHYASDGWKIVALEQDARSVMLGALTATILGDKVVLVLGEEVAGVEKEILDLADVIVEIPMEGQKESFNVSVAAGIALYGLKIVK